MVDPKQLLLNAEGDLVTRDSAGKTVILPRGNDNEVLGVNGTALEWETVGNLQDQYLLIQAGANSIIPSGGTLYLPIGEVVTSDAGFIVSGLDHTIVEMSIVVDSADAANTYEAQLVSDPLGSLTVVSSVELATTNRTATATMTDAVSGGTELALRVVRTAGSGTSDFSEMVVGVRARI